MTQATPGPEVAEPIEMVLGGTGAGPGWRPHSLDLARFAGRRVEVAFQMQVPDPCATVLELDPPALDLWPGPVRPIALRAVLRDGTGALHWSLRAAPGAVVTWVSCRRGQVRLDPDTGEVHYLAPVEPGTDEVDVVAPRGRVLGRVRLRIGS